MGFVFHLCRHEEWRILGRGHWAMALFWPEKMSFSHWKKYENMVKPPFVKALEKKWPSLYEIYQDLPGSIHEDIVMDGHRQGKKAYAYKYPLTFLK